MKKQLVVAASVLVVVFAAFVFLNHSSAWAAQSTADVVIDSAEKEKIRKEIVGSSQLPAEQQEYIIGYGDLLSIDVYGEGDMAASSLSGRERSEAAMGALAGDGSQLRRGAGGAEVRMDGRVSLLHIGDVQVVGMTITQLADYLKKLYTTVFDDPMVTVTLLQSNSRRYTVMGKVNGPGIFYLDFPITIVQAVARSGGFTEWANHDISVIRQGSELTGGQSKNAGKKVINLDYDDFLKGKALEKNVYLQPNDVVIVH